MMRLSLARRVNLLAVVVAATVGILLVTALIAILSLRRAEQRGSRAKDVTVAALRVRTQAIDLESLLRGYVLSENKPFLTLFNQARHRIPGNLRSLRQLVADDPAQRVRAAEVTRDVDAYLTDYAENVITIAQISRTAARGPAAGNEGKRRIDGIQHTLDDLLAAEDSRSKRESAHAEMLGNVAVGIGIGALVLATGLVLVFGSWVTRGVARPVRRVAAAAAEVAGGDLGVRIDEGGAAEIGALISAFNSMTRSLELSRSELLTQNEQLREGERHKRDLISMISHELRTPLSAVLGFTALLRERNFPPDEQRRYLEIIDVQARRLASLAGDFLDVQLLDGGRLKLVRTEFDIVGLVREQVQLFFLETAGHELALDLPEEPVIVDGDRDRLAQVVGNLLSNALKYSPNGGEIGVGIRADGKNAVIAVSDQGIGIRPEDSERIFEKFFRAPEAATVGGTGLGLAVAREIVLSHGGGVAVDSRPGSGSTFTVTIPLGTSTARPAPLRRVV